MAVNFVGFGFNPNAQDVEQLLRNKNNDEGFSHPRIGETQVYSRDPHELHGEGPDTGNQVRWFFSRLGNENRQTPNGGTWTIQGTTGYGATVEKSFTHSHDRSWHLKEYTLSDLCAWALYSVYRK